MSIFLSLKQILITSRPAGWPIFWVSYIGGVLAAQRKIEFFDILYLLVSVPILSFALYSINDIYDYESDKQNSRKQLAIIEN